MARNGQALYWSQVDMDGAGGCWVWRGRLDKSGYGRAGGSELAHRRSYRLLVGPIPDGLVLDHLCRVPRCVNPDHLEPVTVRENTLRGVSFGAINARKTSCVNGHEFSPENTYVWMKPSGRPERSCRACNRAAVKRRKLKLAKEAQR